ncbi:chorismate mutase [Bacillus sp. REN10]|uniref:chorismate mutase n=1 Tax=Bacillus sp. REN10 TaxID=2782541 RepID=UPI00193B3FD9|nr:chorismate mutase [Bacillus sp. REN10]
MIRGIRGATTVTVNNETEMTDATEKLLQQMIKENQVQPDDVCSIFISVTEDLTAAFPAKALRRFDGWSYVPVMCMKEIPVPESLEKCIRVMMHVNTKLSPADVKHIYLEKAVSLRPDLQKQNH